MFTKNTLETTIEKDSHNSSRISLVGIKKSRKKKAILNHLYFNGPNTISFLSQNLNLSVPTTTLIIEELLNEKWLIEIDPEINKQGRPPANYGIKSSEKYTLVLDINTHDTKIFLLNFLNEIIFNQVFDIQLKNNPNFLETVFELIDQKIEEKIAKGKNIIAIGVVMPGLINKNLGINYSYNILSEINKSITDLIAEHFKIPVYILNDSKAVAYGEYRFGLAASKQHVLSINADWGIGLGIVINGEIFEGASGFAGELGHIQANPDGELCYCGKIGCLDTITSASALLKNVKEGLLSGQISKLEIYKNKLEELDLEKVIGAAQDGDSFAIDIIYNIGLELGKGLSIAVHLFNPQIIILDGILSKANKLIVNPMEHAINKYCLSDFKKELTIEATEMGENAKILGIHAYVVDNLFKSI